MDSASLPATLGRTERMKSKSLIDALFMGGRSKSLTAYPLRAVYMRLDADDAQTAAANSLPADGPTQILISVPKRCFKHAVDRNHVKRQVREAYRRHKVLIKDHRLALAFIWLDSKHHDTAEVERRTENLLRRIAERLAHEANLQAEANPSSEASQHSAAKPQVDGQPQVDSQPQVDGQQKETAR